MTLSSFTSKISKAYSYVEYRNLLSSLMEQNKTTGLDQSEAMIEYAKLNIQRMNRIDQKIELDSAFKDALVQLNTPLQWYVITEGWCGDAAQNVPVFALAEKISDKINLKLILRDENSEIMNQYLTNGSKSIPKLICFDSVSGTELFVWGPRPETCQNIMIQLKKEGKEKNDIAKAIHAWYATDKTLSLQRELILLLKNIN
ncbi:MAG: thioredoxin family protein [Sphingobacteriaceae bacterium]|nr:thioredoxin family protein [Sphingobacteriaceae bacterium]